MRKLVWFTVGAVAGIGIGIWFLSGNVLWILAAVAAIAGIVLSLLPFSSKTGKLSGLVLIGFAVGMVWMFSYEQSHIKPARQCDNSFMDLYITVTDYGTVSENGTAAEGTISLNEEKVHVKFYIEEQTQLAPGDTVEGSFYMRYTGYNAHLSPTYHQGKGILLLAYSEGLVHIQNLSRYYDTFSPEKLRQQIKDLLETLFPEDTEGFAKALLLGDSSGLSVKDDRALQNSGIRHIIAVSGLHVSILFSFVHTMVGKRKWLTSLIGIPVLFLFAAVAGFTPSVIRACVMQTVMVLGLLIRREYDSLSSLALAVLVILGINPLSLTSVGFQLSVCSVLGIVLFSGRLQTYIMDRKWLKAQKPKSIRGKLTKWFASSVAVSVSALSLTLPLSAYYFGTVSTVSILTNLLTLWVITYIFCGLVICCVLGAIYAPLGTVLAWLISFPMRYVLVIAGAISKIPYSSVSAENTYIVIWLLLAYGLVLAHLCLRRKGFALTLSCIAAVFCAALVLTAMESSTDHYRVSVLDVGQGQCIIFQSGDGCYVVDCGGDSADAAADLAVNTLRTQGIDRVDGLILTHFDRDHAGGADAFMAQIQTDALYLPDADYQEPLRLELEKAHASKIQWVRSNRYLSFGDAILSIYPAEYGTQGNESSMCILFQSKNCDILITGDRGALAEQALLEAVALPQIDILVTGHHGADNSTSMEFLQALRPKAAVISVGKNNTYGHPAQGLLTRLELFGCQIWRTDQHGTIIFRG